MDIINWYPHQDLLPFQPDSIGILPGMCSPNGHAGTGLHTELFQIIECHASFSVIYAQVFCAEGG